MAEERSQSAAGSSKRVHHGDESFLSFCNDGSWSSVALCLQSLFASVRILNNPIASKEKTTNNRSLRHHDIRTVCTTLPRRNFDNDDHFLQQGKHHGG